MKQSESSASPDFDIVQNSVQGTRTHLVCIELLMGERSKILILEDETLLAWSMREVLSLVGYEVVGVAATVNDALCLAENTRPDLAIVDVALAGRRDGIEGADLLRKQWGTEVLFLTAQGDEATVQRASSVDYAGFLLKPVHSQQLVQAIRRVLDAA